jgi:hypothetical protein
MSFSTHCPAAVAVQVIHRDTGLTSKDAPPHAKVGKGHPRRTRSGFIRLARCWAANATCIYLPGWKPYNGRSTGGAGVLEPALHLAAQPACTA